MNMPVAMSVLWEAVRNEKLSAEDRLKLAYDFDRVLGLRLDEAVPEQTESAPRKWCGLPMKDLKPRGLRILPARMNFATR